MRSSFACAIILLHCFLFSVCDSRLKSQILYSSPPETPAQQDISFGVVGMDPAPGSTGIYKTPTITVTFSEPVDANTLIATTVYLTQGITRINGSFTHDNKSLTFTPRETLVNSTVYTLHVTREVKSLSGIAMAADYQADFTVKDTLQVINAKVNADSNASISVTFNNDLDGKNVTKANFQVMQGATSLAGTLQYKNKTITFIPDIGLLPIGSYTIVVTNNLKDMDGDATSWSLSFANSDYTTGRHQDVAANPDQFTGFAPSAVVDPSGKLLVVTNTSQLFTCNLDGTPCTQQQISAQQPANSGYAPSAVIDTKNSRLVVATLSGLFVCNFSGTSCAFRGISASMSSPVALVDTIDDKLLVATTNTGNGNRPGLLVCELDGTSCAYKDISAGQPANSGYYPSAVIDTLNHKLLVVTSNYANGNRPALFICELDGTLCLYKDISAGQPTISGFAPSAVIDPVNNKLLVTATSYANGTSLGLFICNPDGSACGHRDISEEQHGDFADYDYAPSAVIDTVNGKLLIAVRDVGNDLRTGLFICTLDGSFCLHKDISAGQAFFSGQGPSAIYNAASQRLFIVAENAANNEVPGLFY
jgi:hypothetical protein